MKTSKYLGKYDYINYYTKQPAFWFYANNEIQAAIATYLKYDALDVDAEDDDSYSEEKELDAYEFYQEQKDLLKDIDLNDPNIIQGIIIDKQSREFIKKTYSELKVIDFETNQYRAIKQEEIARMTEQALLDNENVLLFQPVFIFNNLITKPDAVIKQGLEISIIETKGTTTAKLHHFLDLYFQYQVVNGIESLRDFYFSMKLCLVDYCLANKNEVPFVITPYINLSKSVSLTKIPKEERSLIKIGQCVSYSNEMHTAPITIDNLCNQDLSELEFRGEISSSYQTKKWVANTTNLLLQTYNEFSSVIKELQLHKQKLLENVTIMVKNIHPHPNDKSPWKTPDLFALLKPLYIKNGYSLFKYSGNVIQQSADVLKTIKVEHDIAPYFKNDDYRHLFVENNSSIIVNTGSAGKLWKQLKSKKVYFDFETINTPIRPIDHCYPFMQIVTQCSIVKDHQDETPVNELKCKNILFDPANIRVDDFKQMVDCLFEGADYSYIVYNASFEKSRLKEIDTFIGEQSYSEKITVIINNLYDLALFFIPTKNLFPIFIKKLGGFYSIKKVLPFLQESYPHIFEQTACKDYATLPVKNGLVCQTETTKRFYQMINDKQWSELAQNLKIYCENDVRAMVAIEYFLHELLDSEARI